MIVLVQPHGVSGASLVHPLAITPTPRHSPVSGLIEPNSASLAIGTIGVSYQHLDHLEGRRAVQDRFYRHLNHHASGNSVS